MSIPKKLLWLLLVALLAYYAYRHFSSQGGGEQMAGGAPPVSVAEVIGRDVQLWHDFSGRLTAIDQVDIRPQVSGIIEKVHFKDGDKVAKGDVLFTIDPRPFQAALDAAQARATLAEADMKRGEALIKDKAIPQQDYDQRRNNAAVARADLETAKLNLQYTQVRSPISGKASRIEVTEGNLVESGSSAPVLTTVVTNNPIYADFEVDEGTYIRYLMPETGSHRNVQDIPVKMGLLTEDGAPHTGHIESFDNRLNTASGTIRARAVFDNPDGALVPGLFARIRLGSAQKTHAVLITDRAIGTDQSNKYVLVVDKDNKAEHRTITLGGMADGLRIVTEGLKPGEKIIVSGMQRVMMPGQPVKPEMVPMEEASGSGPQDSGKKDVPKTEKAP